MRDMLPVLWKGEGKSRMTRKLHSIPPHQRNSKGGLLGLPVRLLRGLADTLDGEVATLDPKPDKGSEFLQRLNEAMKDALKDAGA